MREMIDKLVSDIVLNKKERAFTKTSALSLTKTKFKNNSHFYESLFLIKKFFNAPKIGIRVIDDLQWVRMGPECKSILDKYGYNYKATVNRRGFWIQPQFKFNRVDGFVGIQLMNTSYNRTGFYRSGVFQDNSLGESAKESFNTYGIKGGATYKINGRNYIFLNASNETLAPLFEDVFISPRTRDLTNPNATTEKITAIEAGYILRAPKTKIRATAYFTQMNDGINK